MTRTTFIASTGCTRTSETRHYTHAVIVDRCAGKGRFARTWSTSAANAARAARTAERAGWKNVSVEEVSVQEEPARTRKPASAAERAPLVHYTVRPGAGGGFDVVNTSGLVVSGDWPTETGARERADYLNARENRKRAEDSLTGPQRRVYAVVKRDGAIGSGYGHSIIAVRGLHAAGLVTLTEYGPGSWKAAYVPPPSGGPVEDTPATGAGVLAEDASHPVAVAALSALSGQPLADIIGIGELGAAAGYWIRPDGDSGRLAVAWVEDGEPVANVPGQPLPARLGVAKELFERTEGWLVEPGQDALFVWHVPTLNVAAAELAAAERARGALTDIWSVTHTGLPEGRYFLRVEAPDADAAFAAALATRAGRLVQRAGHRLGARRLSEADLSRAVGERVRHVASGRTGTVEAVDVRMTGARAYRDGVTVAVDGRSRRTARALEWEPLPAAEDPEAGS
ncbi:hypothetical protein ACFVP0_29010 [Streptomyces cinereoruber]|uniref:hypothetical protein n=1 Tax=Streptomyces cinereoruber TaxID=67260 RepID=UPI0036C1D73A